MKGRGEEILIKPLKHLLCVVLTLIAVVAGGHLLARPLPEAHLSDKGPLFDQVSSFNYVEELVTRFPQRDIWHPDSRAAAAWLKGQLAGFGLEVKGQGFSQFVKDAVVEGQENIYAISRGSTLPDEYILVVAHYDIPPFVTQGAADNGSGVGTALELARVFSRERHNRTIIFLMSDSEEYGAMWGMVNFLQSFPEIKKVKAAIVLDYLNMGEMRAITAQTMGLQQGYTPLWLRELTLRSIGQEGTVSATKGVFEWIERSVSIAPTEAGVLLRAGIPAVNLKGSPVDKATQTRYFHTREDTIDKLRVDALGKYGRATERVLRAVDELPSVPAESMYYFKFGNRYLPNWAVALLQLLFFAPLFYAVIGEYRRLQAAGQYDGAAVWDEVLRWLSVFAAAATGFVALKILPYTGLMYRYEIYPATQKDPVLYNPQFWPPVIILVAVVLGFSVFRRRQAVSGGHWRNRKLAAIVILAVLALATWAGRGGFAAVVFFFLPAYLWPFLVGSRGWAGRLFNLFIVLISNAIFFFFIYQFSNMYDIGVMWWYMLMGASYGLFSIQSVMATVAGLSLYITAVIMAVSSGRAGHARGSRLANKF